MIRLMALSKSKGCVVFDRFSLRRIAYTPQSALLPHTTAGSAMRRLAANTSLMSRDSPNPQLSLPINKFDGGFWAPYNQFSYTDFNVVYLSVIIRAGN